MPAKKRSAVKKKPTAVKKKKRVSRAEPKSIIKRKKSATKKPAKKAAAKKIDKEAKKKAKLAEQHELSSKAAKMAKAGKKPDVIAKKLGISKAKVRHFLNAASVKSKDRLVGTNAEIGAKIAKLRDEEGLPWPKVRARTDGLSGGAIRRLYEEATGKDWHDSGLKKKAEKKTKTAKGKKKVAATKKTKKVKKSLSAAKAEADQAKASGKKAGRPKGRKARREEAARVLRDVIWDTDTKLSGLKKAIEGRTITIEREGLRPVDLVVKTVKDFKLHDREGKVMELVDSNMKARFISTREITALK